ncbi:putative nuclease HARBI1 [Diadema setosum]|uniref:putative nuclease HARBI1 n=1 Tax=Diadema setosum TaxID=31175 RepID=UPI003B3A2231
MAAILQAIQAQAALRRERIFRDRLHPLDAYDDHQLRKLYRFSRAGCIAIINRLAPRIQYPTNRNMALPPSLQVFVSLRYFASGSLLDDTSFVHGIHTSTACRTIQRVAHALFDMRNEVIKFPESPEEVRAANTSFHEIAGMPNIVGAIDGTHVNLYGAPLGNDEYIYINRKGQHSLNVQLICSANYMITNVVARWPGSTHDCRILKRSAIGQRFERRELSGILVGDSGYKLEPWLLTPVRVPQNEADQAYNRAHCKTRVLIEQVNGQVKSKFRCLNGQGIPMAPERASKVIIACCVLHNLSKQMNEPQDNYEIEEADQPAVHDQELNNPAGLAHDKTSSKIISQV